MTAQQPSLPLPKHPRRVFSWLAAFAVLLLTAVPLHAHHLPPGMEDVDEFEDGAAFMAGLRHPLLGMDHWLFAVAVGAIALASQRAGSARALLTSLLLGVTAGGMMGLNDMMLPGIQFSLVLALAAPAVLFMLRDKLPSALQIAVVGWSAISQGNVHGLAWPVEAASASYMAGMVVMTSMLALSGSAMVWAARRPLALRRSTAAIPL